MANTKQQRKNTGLCTGCGKQPPRPNVTKCQTCADKDAEYKKATYTRQQEKRAARLVAGLCQYCGKHPVVRGRKCQPCQQRDNAKHQAWLTNATAKRMALKICVSCGREPVAPDSLRRCVNCLHDENQRMRNPAGRERSAYNRRQWTARLRLQVIDYYTQGTRKCMCPHCPTVGHEFLTIDHVHNDGNTHRKTIKSALMPRWVIKNNYPPNIQILCWNCNAAKQFYGNGVCPHVRNATIGEPATS